ncbi:hypothetical protein PYH37_005213 [Sinorhizobium numidicum]|uniref:Uncharacterized protein n=1 Tax=Sinorhizobium numidicum TaxID=680248 RepID=A0ABY8D1G4_9HYPH|nr:hypothetical protein [Sinorhizobium numidicum]WEX76862.1 hypothetical protein PYH37_005213 [Sinorhizobium numidicum]WEX83522.1 hypothetical protein PYH38_002306 [Sinorhizobium numidicum]
MSVDDFLDGLLTPEEIARRITASSGVHMTARTVWEKAKRLGVAKKIGRSPLIHLSDVPRLLEVEKHIRLPAYRSDFDPIASNSRKRALAALRKKRLQR